MSVHNRVWAAVAMSLVLVACGAEGSAVAPAAAPVETTPASTMAMEDMSHDSTTLRFVADIPGVFEVELEMSAKRLFGLTVR